MLTTGRQDWGILRSTCAAIASLQGLELVLLVGGMHLSDRHGRTVSLILDDGFMPAVELPWLDWSPDEDPPAAVQAGRAVEFVAGALRAHDPSTPWCSLGDRLETALRPSPQPWSGLPSSISTAAR